MAVRVNPAMATRAIRNDVFVLVMGFFIRLCVKKALIHFGERLRDLRVNIN